MFICIAFVFGHCAPSLFAENIDLRLQIVWGGGENRQWSGRIFIEDGSFSDLRLLGTEADSPGTVVAGQQIVIRQRSPRQLDGIELVVRGEKSSHLQIELLPVGQVQNAEVVRLRLEELIDRSRTVPLDQQRNELRVGRLSSDRIRVEFDRKHLVFAPGEDWVVDISPHLISDNSPHPTQCHMRIVAAGTGREVWSNTEVLKPDLDGRYESIKNINIPIPEIEGAYNLELELLRPGRRLTLRNKKIVADRMVQFVVVADQSPDTPPGTDRVVLEFDPAERNWWSSLVKLPQWYLLPGFKQNGPLGDHKTVRWQHRSRQWTQLQEQGWQAYPLPIEEVGQPHELQIEYPSDVAQTTIFSIVEPNSAGKVLPIGLDTGIDVTPDDATGIAARPFQVAEHRIRFWPNTKSPLLLVTNQRKDARTTFGSVRIVHVGERGKSIKPGRNRRKLVAQWHRPLFNQTFSAPEAYDQKNGGSFEDWHTFFSGGRRMVEHLKSVGYDGVSISCFSDGSTIYPSRYLQPTPKHDRGAYFSDGRDVLRKDVLEMLFRLCDREGIALIPIIDFATPLPPLERTRRDHPRNANGIVLVDEHGQSWEEKNNGSRRGRAPYYNPLDSRVQTVMLAVVREIRERYDAHPSFGGIQLAMTPESFSHLPGVEWGLDATTIRRFQFETGQLGDIKKTSLRAARVKMLSAKVRPHWINWRCALLAKFHTQLQAEINHRSPAAKLYLSATQLIDSKPLREVFAPKLLPERTTREGLSELGIDFGLIAENKNICILRPHRFSPITDLSAQGSDLELNSSAELDSVFNDFENAAAEFFHIPQRIRLDSFDEVSPFGKDKTFTSLVAHVSSSDYANRRRFIQSLAIQDPTIIFDGGWMLPLGQERALLPFISVFRQLPARKFESVDEPHHPLIIRKTTLNGDTYMYIANNSPWDVGATLRFRMPETTRVVPLGDRILRPFRFEGRLATWDLNLRPYDLVACRISQRNPQLINVSAEFPPNVEPLLTQRVENLRSRVRSLQQPTSLPSIANAGFEGSDLQNPTPGWQVETGPNGVAKIVTTDNESGRSLRITNPGGVTLITSSPFPIPENRRLAFSIKTKLLPRSAPPLVKLHVSSNSNKMEAWEAILPNGRKPVGDEWKELIFPLQQLSDEMEGSITLNIEVRGPCDLLVDDITTYDSLLLGPEELVALNERIALVKYALQTRDYADCLNQLQGFWPRYLMQSVPQPKGMNVANRQAGNRPPKKPWIRGVLDKAKALR